MTTPTDAEKPLPTAVARLLDFGLSDWREYTSDAAIRRGIEWYRTHRISDVGLRLNGIDFGLAAGAKGEPEASAAVGFDGDALAVQYFPLSATPSDADDAWSAAVAGTLALQATHPVSEALVRSEADRVREDRVRRAQTGVDVEPPPGRSKFGVWQARSIDYDRPGRPPYRVHLRAADAPINGCTCPDYLSNELGTCKHIEAVLMRLPASVRRSVHPLVVPYTRFDPAKVRGIQVPADHVAWFETLDLRVPLSEAFISEAPARALRYEWPGASDDNWFATLRMLQKHAVASVGPDLHAEAEAHARREAEQAHHDAVRAELAELPDEPGFINARLFPYQKEGVVHLAARGCAVLADEMGLGKTLQAITAMRYLQLRGDVKATLIVCPASLMYQWRNELQRFAGVDAVVVEGNAALRERILRDRHAIVITSYDRVIRDFGLIKHVFSPDLVIADEAQRFKNWQTRSAAFMKALDSRFRFALTGTPLENRLLELYSIVDFVDAQVLGPMWKFLREYHTLDHRGGPVMPRNIPELRERISGVVLRRERALIADQLPTKQEVRMLVPLDDKQRDHHDAACTTIERLGAIRHQRPLSPLEEKRLQAAIGRARMSCDCAGLLDGTTLSSPKLDLFAELVEQLCGDPLRKVVVFSQWVKMGELAAMHAERAGVGVLRLHGGLTAPVRAGLVERFATDPDARVLVCSDAGATGLNLQFASALIHLDMPWTPALLNQRSARIYRLGQNRPVLIYTLLADESYELHVESTVLAKARLFEATLGDAEPEDVDDDVSLSADSSEPGASAMNAEGEIDWALAPADREATPVDDDASEAFDDPPPPPSSSEADPPLAAESASASVVETTAPRPGRPVAGAPSNPAQAAVVSAIMKSMWDNGKQRLALELLLRSASLQAASALGASMPTGWEALTEWWLLEVASVGALPAERCVTIAAACGLLASHPGATVPAGCEGVWAALIGES